MPTPIGTLTAAEADFGREAMAPWQGTTADLIFKGALYDPLIGSDDKGALSKATGLASDWKVEGSVVTFTMRRGVTFHDGTEFTAEDAKFSIEKSIAAAINTSAGGLKTAITSMEVPERYTLRITLKTPNAIFLHLLAWVEGDVAMAPKAYAERVGDAGFEKAPVGTGPYKFVAQQKDVSLTLEANTDYWDKSRLSRFKTLKLLKIKEVGTRINLLKTGGADLVRVTADQVPKLQAEGFKLFTVRNSASPMLVFNQCWDSRFITNKVKFRQAMIEAIDLKSVIKAFYPPGTGDVPNGGPLFSPVTLGYDPSLPTYPYNPDNAGKLLQEIGYAGEKIEILSFGIFAIPQAPEILQAFQAMWKAVGINAVITPVDVNIWRDKYRAGPSPDKPQGFDPPGSVAIASPLARPSGLNNFRTFAISHKAGGTVSMGCDLAKNDAIIDRLLPMMDTAKLDEELRRVNQDLYKDYWALPIVYTHDTWMGKADRVAAWSPVPGTPLYFRWETVVPGTAVK